MHELEHELRGTSTGLSAHLAACEVRAKNQEDTNREVTSHLDKLFSKVSALDKRVLVVSFLAAGTGSGIVTVIGKVFAGP